MPTQKPDNKKTDGSKSNGFSSKSNAASTKGKKKWCKGKLREKLENKPLFSEETYERLYKEIPNLRCITPSVVSERLKITVSLAKQGLEELCSKGLIVKVVSSSKLMVYTKASQQDDA